MTRKLLLAALLSVASAPAIAAAAMPAVTTANVNLRAGPGTNYPVVVTMPAGARVVSYGCVSGYTWCDISWGSERGWVAASYMQVVVAGKTVVLAPAVAPRVGLAVVAFDQSYWRRYYVGRPWYGRWAYYGGAPGPVYRRGGVVCKDGVCNGRATVVGPRGRIYHREGSISKPP